MSFPLNTMYQWIAYYNDGTTLEEEGHSYADIDKSKLERFVLQKDGTTALVVDVPEGWQFIYRKRTFMKPGVGSVSMWITGCQKKDRGVNKQYITLLHEDGRVVVTERFRDELAELAPPTIREGEDYDL